MTISFEKSKMFNNRFVIVIEKHGTPLNVYLTYLTRFEVKELSRLMKEEGF